MSKALPALSRRQFTLGAVAVSAAAALSACGTRNEATSSEASANSDSASATSVADFGGMEGLIEAAKAEGELNVIALPRTWANYGAVIDLFKETYGITVNEQNPNASSQEEIDAASTNAGTDAAPDVFDIGINVAVANTDYFAPYKVANWDQIPDEVKDADGLYCADYSGVMTVGWNADEYGDIDTSGDLLETLSDSKFVGTVALNGKPAEAGSAFNGFLAMAYNQGGDISDLQPGLDFFAGLKDAGSLTTIDVTEATISSGQTGVVFDWNYNQASTVASLEEQGVTWDYATVKNGQMQQYYNQAIYVQAPHPAAARLWQEFLYSPEAQNLWMEGGAFPVLKNWMDEEGTTDEAAAANLVELDGDTITYTVEEAAEATTWLEENWDATIGN